MSGQGPSGPLSGVEGPSGPLSGVAGPSGPLSGVEAPSGPDGGGRTDHGTTGSLNAEDLAYRARALAQAHPLTALARRYVDRSVADQRTSQPVP